MRRLFMYACLLFRGTCCSPSVHINIIDTDGFIAQCELQFSNGRTVKSVEVVSTATFKSPVIV